MSTFKKCKVAMLPTKEKADSNLFIGDLSNQKLQQLKSVLRRLKEILYESEEDWNDIGSESREIKMASIIGRMQGSIKFNTSILEDTIDTLNEFDELN